MGGHFIRAEPENVIPELEREREREGGRGERYSCLERVEPDSQSYRLTGDTQGQKNFLYRFEMILWRDLVPSDPTFFEK